MRTQVINMKKFLGWVFIIGFVFLLSGYTNKSKYEFIKEISLDMETKKMIAPGKYIKMTGVVYYSSIKSEMIITYSYPEKYFLQTNHFGEVKMYYPSKNEVIITQNAAYSTKGHLLFYFLHHKSSDMGLSEMGFTNTSMRRENNYEISEWIPPSDISHLISKVQLVNQQFHPVFMGYYDTQGKLIKKTYFSKYQQISSFQIPMSVVDIEFPKNTQDSLITYTKYQNVRTNEQIEPVYKEFKIPDNAKITSVFK